MRSIGVFALLDEVDKKMVEGVEGGGEASSSHPSESPKGRLKIYRRIRGKRGAFVHRCKHQCNLYMGA